MNNTTENKCYNCNDDCSLYSEYQDDGRTFCSLDCLNMIAVIGLDDGGYYTDSGYISEHDAIKQGFKPIGGAQL